MPMAFDFVCVCVCVRTRVGYLWFGWQYDLVGYVLELGFGEIGAQIWAQTQFIWWPDKNNPFSLYHSSFGTKWK